MGPPTRRVPGQASRRGPNPETDVLAPDVPIITDVGTNG
jgi:hypothetical protein